ncbi:RNA polymerase sigma factor [Thermatribacter velox]|uniref:RNA polymerase sigma factor n=1 Tax=Thermatribacter velox TaxID=3039681 RepID=A0ABZ2YAI3_9BACT
MSLKKNDREIIQEVLQGNTELFRLLVQKYERAVFNYVFRMVRQREEAEDLTQETFVKAFCALRKYDSSYEFSTWIFRIALNVCRDFFRRRKFAFLSLSQPVGEEGEEELEQLVEQSAFSDPDGVVLDKEMVLEMEKAIARLPLKLREVIVLRHIENLSYEEIAKITGLPLGTVKTYLHRARKKLKEWLQEYFGPDVSET